MREQTGSFRVNCIDCLDRTNVVESALARHILTSQLTQVGMTPDVMTSNIDFVYNDGELRKGNARLHRAEPVHLAFSLGKQRRPDFQAVCWNQCIEGRLHPDRKEGSPWNGKCGTG